MAEFPIKTCMFTMVMLSIPATMLAVKKPLTKANLIRALDQKSLAFGQLGAAPSTDKLSVAKHVVTKVDMLQTSDQRKNRLLDTAASSDLIDTAKHVTTKIGVIEALDQTNIAFGQIGSAAMPDKIDVTNPATSTTDLLQALDQKNLAFGQHGTAGTSERMGVANRVTSNLLSACTLLNGIFAKSENLDVMSKTIPLAELLAANAMKNGPTTCILDSYLSVIQIFIQTCAKLDACARPTSSLLPQSGQSDRSTNNVLMDHHFNLQRQPMNVISQMSTDVLPTPSMAGQRQFTTNVQMPHEQRQLTSQISQRMAQISNWLTTMERLMASQQRAMQVRNIQTTRRRAMQTQNDQMTSMHQRATPLNMLSNQQRQQLQQQQQQKQQQQQQQRQVQENMQQMSSGPMTLIQSNEHHARPVIRSRAMRFRTFPQQPFMIPLMVQLNEQQKRKSRFQARNPSAEGRASTPAPEAGD